jgi:hypothetical protein
LVKVPVLPLPDESMAVDPVPSSNFQYPTRPEGGVTVKAAEVSLLAL